MLIGITGGSGKIGCADHLRVPDEAITTIPAGYRRRLMITCDGAGASHALITRLDQLACRPGHQLIYSVGWDHSERERPAISKVVGIQALEARRGRERVDA